jgi:hypothetical protein
MSLSALFTKLVPSLRDAARYRFLRGGILIDHGIYDDGLLRCGDDLDRTVDAAIIKTTSSGSGV